MGTEFLYPASDALAGWGSNPVWSRVDDDVAHGGGDDGLNISSTVDAFQFARCNVSTFVGMVVSAIDVRMHAKGTANGSTANAKCHLYTPGAATDFSSRTWVIETSTIKFGSVETLHPDTGNPFTLDEVLGLQIHFTDQKAAGELRRFSWGHMDVSTVEGTPGGGVFIGACYWPPLVAALGDMLLRYEPLEKIQRAINAVWGCRGHRPLLTNPDEREIVLDALQFHPKYVFLGR